MSQKKKKNLPNINSLKKRKEKDLPKKERKRSPKEIKLKNSLKK